MILAGIIGAATLRLRGPYFTLATLSAAAVVLSLILHYAELTGGPSGLADHLRHTIAARSRVHQCARLLPDRDQRYWRR